MSTAVIYRIITPSNFIYVGCTINIKDRKNDYRTLQCKQQRLIYNALIKHPFDTCNFMILETCDATIRHEVEQFWIKEFNSHRRHNKFGLNMTYGGMGSSGLLLTGNGLKNRIGLHKGDKNGNFGRKHGIEARNKISASHKGNKYWEGKNHTSRSKLKISSSKKGQVPPNKGVPMSDGQKRLLSMSKSSLILNFETGVFYNGGKEAAYYNNIKHGTLKDWLSGKHPNRSSLKIA